MSNQSNANNVATKQQQNAKTHSDDENDGGDNVAASPKGRMTTVGDALLSALFRKALREVSSGGDKKDEVGRLIKSVVVSLGDESLFDETVSDVMTTIVEQGVETDSTSELLTDRIDKTDVKAIAERVKSFVENGVNGVDADVDARRTVVLLLKLFDSLDVSEIIDVSKLASAIENADGSKNGSVRGRSIKKPKTGFHILRDGLFFKPIVIKKGETVTNAAKYKFDENTHQDNLDSQATVWKTKRYVPLPDGDGSVPKVIVYNECIEFSKAWVVIDEKQCRPKLIVKPTTVHDRKSANTHMTKELKDFIYSVFERLNFIEWTPNAAQDKDSSNSAVDKDGVFDDLFGDVDVDDSSDGGKKEQQQQQQQDGSGAEEKSSDSSGGSGNDDNGSSEASKNDEVVRKLGRLYKSFMKQAIYSIMQCYALDPKVKQALLSSGEDGGSDPEALPKDRFYDVFSALLPQRIGCPKNAVTTDDASSDEVAVQKYVGLKHNPNGGKANARTPCKYSAENLYVSDRHSVTDPKFKDNGWNLYFQPSCIYFPNKEQFDECVAKLKRCSLDVDEFDDFVASLPYSKPKKNSASAKKTDDSSNGDRKQRRKNRHQKDGGEDDKRRKRQKKSSSSSSDDESSDNDAKISLLKKNSAKKSKNVVKKSTKSAESSSVRKKSADKGKNKRKRDAEDDDVEDDEKRDAKRRKLTPSDVKRKGKRGNGEDTKSKKKKNSKKSKKEKSSSSSSSDDGGARKKATTKGSDDDESSAENSWDF